MAFNPKDEPYYEEQPVDVNNLYRMGRRFTVFAPDTTSHEVINEVFEPIKNLLDQYRFTFRFSTFMRAPIALKFINLYPAREYYAGWKNIEPKDFEDRTPPYLDKIGKVQHSFTIGLTALYTKDYGDAKFNSLSRFAKLFKATDATLLLGKDGNETVDCVFIYTQDGIESMDDLKRVHGDKIDWKAYPDYFSLYSTLRLAEMLGYKVFNLGKAGVVKSLEDWLATNYDSGKSAEWVVDNTKRACPIPKYLLKQPQRVRDISKEVTTGGEVEQMVSSVPAPSIDIPAGNSYDNNNLSF